MSDLHDQKARERTRDEHAVSLFVEAGAGTGKTTALVDRVVALVATGSAELRQIAAITFTEAAAAELRDRVRAALERVATGTDERLDDAAARRRCHDALDQLDDAALTTLHGFAQRLLSEHPFEVGLPPGFRILEAVEASVEFEQRWTAFVDQLFDDATLEPALLTWIAGNLSVGRLRPLAEVLCEYHDRLPSAPPPGPIPSLRIGPLVDAIDGLLALYADRCLNTDDALARHLEGLQPTRDGLADAEDELDRLRAVYDLGALQLKQGGRQEHWDDITMVRDACTAAEELRDQVVTEQRQAALAILLARLVGFARGYAAERRRDGRLLFHDLLVLARDLLRDHPAAWAAATDRYRYLLVDEFQDTDPLQIELAVLLAADGPHPAGRDWRDIPIRAGALVLVGDPKQSIYRFRDADLRVYHDAQARLGLSPVALIENFRSVPPILDVVNAAFAELLIDEPGVQAAHVPLVAHRDGDPDVHRVVTLGGEHDAPMVEVRQREARDVAAAVHQIVEEQWPVHDPTNGTVRAATEHDIALLIPSRTVLPALEGELERAGIPVRVESQSLVFSTTEVRDLLQVLTAVDDPTDELAVVAALRSSAFGCSDDDLVGHVAAGGSWDYRREAQPEGPVGEALGALREFWQARWWRSVTATVDAVVRDRHLLELATVHRRPRDHWRRIRFLLDQARAWDDAGGTSLRRFVEWARRQADEGVRVNEAVAPEPDDPALRILTVHGAKGLEFPIVILAGLSTLPSTQAPAVLFGADGPELRVGSVRGGLVTTPGYPDRRTDERRHEAAERLRLLYVAMTRARDHLVISLHHKTSKRPDSCHAARLAPSLAAVGVASLTPPPPPPPRTPRPGPPPASAAPAARERWQQTRAALLAQASVASSVAATTLAETTDTDRDAPGDVEPRPPWQRGRAGTALGRAVHAVLQSVDFETGAGLEATARAQAMAEGVADREDEVRGLAASVLASPVVQAAVAGGWDRWRELPVAAEVDGVLLEGFVDLLLRSPDGLVVVDYKTDAVARDDELDAAVGRYSIQGAAYALALEAALGEPVVRCVFVFARLPRAAEREITDLGAATAAARGRLAASVS